MPPFGSLRTCPHYIRPPPPLLHPSLPRFLWPRSTPVSGLSLCRGEGGLRPRPPVSTLSPLPPPLPLPLLPVLSLPLYPRMCRACCLGAGAWPLGGPPPGGELTILSTISQACSSGAPFSPNGGGVTPLRSLFGFRSPLLSLTEFVHKWGASAGLGGLPPSPV